MGGFDSNNVDSSGDNNVSPYPNQAVNTDLPNNQPGFSNQSTTTTNTSVMNIQWW